MVTDEEKESVNIKLPSNAHMIRWTKDKIKRIWEFYELNPQFKDWFYSETQAKAIVKLAKRYLKRMQKY